MIRTRTRTWLRRSAALLLFAASVGSCGAPVTEPGRRDRAGNVQSVFVTIVNGDRGTPAMPRPYSPGAVTYTIRIEARGADGRPVTDADTWASLSVTPGVLQSIEGPNVAGRNVQLVNGVADGVRVTFVRAYGETRIAAEEAGYVPGDLALRPACSNGMDDDNDGRVDFPADYGCAAANDNTERGGSYALGTSESIFFASPTLADVQGRASQTALLNERVTVTSGRLIVTRISVSGFWITDVADTSCMGMPCYNSIFAFNFRLPEGLRPCDRLAMIQGGVQEFTSTTQFAQPAWSVAPDGLWVDERTSGRCPIPPAFEITPMVAASVDTLEQVESSLVRVRDVTLSPNIGPDRPTCRPAGMTGATCDFAPGRSNCDANGDNRIDFRVPAESDCANACQVTAGCSEWTGWVRFGQLAVDFDMPATGATRMIIAPREADSNFNPQQPPGAMPRRALAVTGTIKQVGPNWIIEPRCRGDMVLQGDGQMVLDANQTCLQPRTVTEEP